MGASACGSASAVATPGDDTGWAATGPIPAAGGVRAAGAGVDGDTGGGAAVHVGHGRAFFWLAPTPCLAGACAQACAAVAAARYARLPPLTALASAPTMSCGRRRLRPRPCGWWKCSVAVGVRMKLGVFRPHRRRLHAFSSPTAIEIPGVAEKPPIFVV